MLRRNPRTQREAAAAGPTGPPAGSGCPIRRAGVLFRGLNLAVIAVATGCGRSPHLAGGPIDLGGAPRYVSFERVVSTASQDPAWELCYEFDPPGGSLSAGAIDAVLRTVTGERYRFVDAELDRRGEAVVCRVGRLERMGPGRGSMTADSLAIGGVELASGVRVRLQGLRGGPLER